MSAKTVKVATVIFVLTLNVFLSKSQENSEEPEESSVPWIITVLDNKPKTKNSSSLSPITDDSTIYTMSATRETPSRTTLPENQPDATSPPSRTLCPESIYYDRTSNTNITFPETPPTFATTSNELCLCSGSQITRVCLDEGNWGEPSGSCCDLLETTQLYNVSFGLNRQILSTISQTATQTLAPEPPSTERSISTTPCCDGDGTETTSTTDLITTSKPTTPFPSLVQCPQEHYYDEISNRNLTFPETPIQVQITPKEICLCDGKPILRMCSRNGTWNKPNGSCCDANTTTHFTILVSRSVDENFVEYVVIVVILLIIGIIVSLSALLFPRWRKKIPNKIICSLVISLCVLLITFCVSVVLYKPWADGNDPETTNTSFPSPVKCSKKHYYDQVSNRNLTFPETPIGVQITSEEICVCDGKPILRMCSRDGTWNEPNGSCCNTSDTKIAQDLNKLLTNMTDKNLITTIETTKDITENNSTQLAPIDIHLIAKILDNARENEILQANPSDFLETVNNIMNVNDEVLSSSQRNLNSTDTILYSLDKMLLNSNIKDVFNYSNLLAFPVSSSERTGAMIRSTGGKTCSSFDIVYLNKNDYENHLQNTSFEIAVVVPLGTDNVHYFITLFCKETLFNQEKTPEYGSWTISILFAGDTHYTPKSQIKIYFKKKTNDSSNHNCNYWKYGFDNRIPITGRWQNDSTAQEYREDFYSCEVNHTTHFTILFGPVIENLVLDVITIFGSILSIIGIAIVFLSALLFKHWRKKVQNKILLNISVCLLLLIILFQISDNMTEGSGCIVVGIMLHYFVIAQFCWTLVISYCNYHRIIKVTSKKPTHILAKYCTFAWGTPIIVVAIVAAINPDTYDKTGKEEPPEICYPKGIHQTLGLLLPVSLILAINLSLFIFILIKLTGENFEIRRHQIRKSYQIQKPIILMFFMMGLTWTFGILATFTKTLIFDYLFCLLATFQGFVIFIFYILDSKVMNTEWRNLICGSRNKPTTRSSIETVNPHSQEGLVNA